MNDSQLYAFVVVLVALLSAFPWLVLWLHLERVTKENAELNERIRELLLARIDQLETEGNAEEFDEESV